MHLLKQAMIHCRFCLTKLHGSSSTVLSSTINHIKAKSQSHSCGKVFISSGVRFFQQKGNSGFPQQPTIEPTPPIQNIDKPEIKVPPPEENKGRWSGWTGKNAWKGGFVFLGVTFIGIGGILVYNWGK